MNLSEFARDRGVEPQTISRYIGRHQDVFADHIKIKGKSKELDKIALTILEKQYPLPSPVQVIEDNESRKKLIESQEMVIQLQQQIMKMQMELNKYQLTEYKQEMLEADLDKIEAENGKLLQENQRLSEVESENEKLQEELAIEKNKSWWDKLRGK